MTKIQLKHFLLPTTVLDLIEQTNTFIGMLKQKTMAILNAFELSGDRGGPTVHDICSIGFYYYYY